MLYVVGNSVQFYDDVGHWKNGLCRLLEISDENARQLIELAVDLAAEKYGQLYGDLSVEAKIACLKEAVQRHFHLQSEFDDTGLLSRGRLFWGTSFDGAPADKVFAHSIGGNYERLIVGSLRSEYAWQINAADNRPVSAASVVYDRSYYDSPRQAHCGMRDYIRHDDWRMEKSRRLLRTVLKGAGERAQSWLADPACVKALDVGSASGYFRQALSEAGFQHYGVDVSADAVGLGRENFGFHTWEASLFELPTVAPSLENSLSIITLWDAIEHLDDPLAAVKLLSTFLEKQGVLAVRTPSLTAFEADILGDMYYSFKLDHIRYFSPRSLTRLMEIAGLQQIYLETTSHLFNGLLGANFLFQQGQKLNGADIVALFSR